MTSKGIVYYTDSRLNDKYAIPVRKQLNKIGLPIVSASLLPLDFGINITFTATRGYMTMFEQILAALQLSESEIIFFAEHDILYHPSHFDFYPVQDNVFYYNQNVWKVRASDGHALHYLCSQTSGLCAYRQLLIEHYSKRIEYIKDNGYSSKIGFEPGTHNRIPELSGKSDVWMSEYPNIDIRHDDNLTTSRWRKDQFRNQKYTEGWTESDTIPGWGTLDEVLKMI